MDKDTYNTILKPSEAVLFKDRNSKFFGYAFPAENEEQVKNHIESLKKQHHTARHWCYAFQFGTKEVYYRANDDGEPSNSAGMPIYGQIQSFGVTNILIVVVRYFGGTKLGVGGLINAYRTAAQMALEASDIIEKTINDRILIQCSYENMNKVMRLVKEKNLKVVNQDMQLDCKIMIEVRSSHTDTLVTRLKSIHQVTFKVH